MKGNGNLEVFVEYEDLVYFNKLDVTKADLKQLISLSRDGKNNMYSELYYKHTIVDEETESNLFVIHIKPIKYKVIHTALWIMILSIALVAFTRIEKIFGFEANIDQSNEYLKNAWTKPFKNFECYLEIGGNTELGQALMKNEKIHNIVESIKLEKQKTKAEKHNEFINSINGGEF